LLKPEVVGVVTYYCVSSSRNTPINMGHAGMDMDEIVLEDGLAWFGPVRRCKSSPQTPPLPPQKPGFNVVSKEKEILTKDMREAALRAACIARQRVVPSPRLLQPQHSGRHSVPAPAPMYNGLPHGNQNVATPRWARGGYTPPMPTRDAFGCRSPSVPSRMPTGPAWVTAQNGQKIMIQVEVKMDEHEQAHNAPADGPFSEPGPARVMRRPQSATQGLMRRSGPDASPGSHVAAPPVAPSGGKGALPGAVVELAADLQRLTAQLKEELKAHGLAAKRRQSAFEEALREPAAPWSNPEPEACIARGAPEDDLQKQKLPAHEQPQDQGSPKRKDAPSLSPRVRGQRNPQCHLPRRTGSKSPRTPTPSQRRRSCTPPGFGARTPPTQRLLWEGASPRIAAVEAENGNPADEPCLRYADSPAMAAPFAKVDKDIVQLPPKEKCVEMQIEAEKEHDLEKVPTEQKVVEAPASARSQQNKDEQVEQKQQGRRSQARLDRSPRRPQESMPRHVLQAQRARGLHERAADGIHAGTPPIPEEAMLYRPQRQAQRSSLAACGQGPQVSDVPPPLVPKAQRSRSAAAFLGNRASCPGAPDQALRPKLLAETLSWLNCVLQAPRGPPPVQNNAPKLSDACDDEGEVGYDEITFEEAIGAGSFGAVYKGHCHGQEVAIKQCKVGDEKDAQMLLREIRYLQRLRHPSLVSFLGCCSRPPHVFLLMEFMPAGSLHALLFNKKDGGPPRKGKGAYLSFAFKAGMALQVAEGLAYLHDLSVVHRDLKTMNIILDEQLNCKICDFGLTITLERSHVTVRSLQGSPRYMAPEQFESNAKITEKVDLWQMGCVMMELFCLAIPFQGFAGVRQIATELIIRRRAPQVPSHADERAQVLVQACLRIDAKRRPTAAALVEALIGVKAVSTQ